MSRYSDKDQYCYEGTDVLINKLNILDDEILLEKERKITSINTILIYDKYQKDNAKFNLKCYYEIHKKLFFEIYPFAGKVRNVTLRKGNTRFCEPQYIEPYLKELFNKLKYDKYLEKLSKKDFIQKIAFYYSELNAVHPFREGNGRTNRIFIDLLSKSNGYNLNIDNWDEKEQVNAMIGAMKKNYNKLLKMIGKNIKYGI